MKDPVRVGMTTTIPVEVVLASGAVPVDLNNYFVTHQRRDEFIERAEQDGFPTSSCVWVKGIYGAVVTTGVTDRVIGVVEGDCSATHVLLEALELQGIDTVPFSFPYSREREDLDRELVRFMETFGVSKEEVEEVRMGLAGVRRKLATLDELTWKENLVTGYENHLFLVSASDMRGDPGEFERQLDEFLRVAMSREPLDRVPEGRREVRLGYAGVPPVVDDLYQVAESMGARFVFNEVQRQFVMFRSGRDLTEQYLLYTYPYSLMGRVEDLSDEVERRRIDGLVHYVQSFCHRNLEDVVFKREIGCPLLNLECDKPGQLEAGARMRLENFVQVLGENL